MAESIQSGVDIRTIHLPHCKLCKSKEAIGCAFQPAETFGSPTKILENNLKTPNGIMAAPDLTITSDKREDVVLYL